MVSGHSPSASMRGASQKPPPTISPTLQWRELSRRFISLQTYAQNAKKYVEDT
jgi:hypothetical protein